MFLLGKAGGPFLNDDYYLDSDEFGWWLNAPDPDPEAPSVTSEVSTRSTARRGSSTSLKEKSSSRSSSPEFIEDRDEEVCYAEEPPCKTSSRSYTPERLVRTQDYAIRTNSPTLSRRFNSGKGQRRLNCLIDQRLVGASQLEALFEPANSPEIEFPVPSANGRKLSPGTEALLAIANAESPTRCGTPDLESSGSSCDKFKRTELGNSRSDCTEESGDETLAVESWKIRDDRYIVDEAFDHPELALRQLRGRIQNLRDINRDIFADIETLRKNFQSAERKTGSLTLATNRLRREIRDLRYLDDLVNLLRGELERISQRNWPFNIGRADLNSEEVNLVV